MNRGFLADYEPVEDRLRRFYNDHPTGRVETWRDWASDDYTAVTFGARVYLDSGEETLPKASGFAYELVTSSGVNKTSHVENCETSAIGRALANAGYAPKGARPSREEMQKATAPSPVEPPKAASEAQVDKIRELAAAAGRDMAKVDVAIEAQRAKHDGIVPAGWAGAQIGRLTKASA